METYVLILTITVFGINSGGAALGTGEYTSKPLCEHAGQMWIESFGATEKERTKRYGKDAFRYECTQK